MDYMDKKIIVDGIEYYANITSDISDNNTDNNTASNTNTCTNNFIDMTQKISNLSCFDKINNIIDSYIHKKEKKIRRDILPEFNMLNNLEYFKIFTKLIDLYPPNIMLVNHSKLSGNQYYSLCFSALRNNTNAAKYINKHHLDDNQYIQLMRYCCTFRNPYLVNITNPNHLFDLLISAIDNKACGVFEHIKQNDLNIDSKSYTLICEHAINTKYIYFVLKDIIHTKVYTDIYYKLCEYLIERNAKNLYYVATNYIIYEQYIELIKIVLSNNPCLINKNIIIRNVTSDTYTSLCDYVHNNNVNTVIMST
jgi:hypothetical protein